MTEVPQALLWGLRRYLAAGNAAVRSLHRQPFAGGLSGSTLEYWHLQLHRAGIQATITLVYKRGAVVEGAFLRAAPQREAHAYAVLPQRIPVAMPTAVAFDLVTGDIWLLPFPPSRNTTHWTADWGASHVHVALADLAKLHASYWQDEQIIVSWPWLSQPTLRDADALMTDARLGIEAILHARSFDESLTPDRMQSLLALAWDPGPLLQALNQGPITLLHGDAGFQNIAITRDGLQRLWYDWQLVAAGPAALDLATFLHPWAYPDADPPLPIPSMVDHYLASLSQRGIALNPAHFHVQIQAALLWRWLIQWAPLLGLYRQRLRPEVRRHLYHAFRQLHWPALAEWVNGV